jgi:SAM-dependent methyltransferase
MAERGIDATELAARVREAMNRSVTEHGHHPGAEYHPSAVRHYVRERALLRALAGLPFETALDVGCAEGFFVSSLRSRLGKEVWGVDISDVAARRAAARLGGSFAAGDALDLPAADGSFDLVYSTETIEHVLDPERMIAEMRRVARRWVVVTTPISESEHEHEPDFEQRHEGHVNDFDAGAVRRLFGPDARIGSFRCNSSFALVLGVGRYLPRPLRDGFYGFDNALARRAGKPDHRLRPLRNRDWLIVADAAGSADGSPAWACPRCKGPLAEDGADLRCPRDEVRYPATEGVPDFAAVPPSA